MPEVTCGFTPPHSSRESVHTQLLPKRWILRQEEPLLATRLAVEIANRADLTAVRRQMANFCQEQGVGRLRALGKGRQEGFTLEIHQRGGMQGGDKAVMKLFEPLHI